MSDSPWEPTGELEYVALDRDSEPMFDDPEQPQVYGDEVAIGFSLHDGEAARSVATVSTGEGRDNDEALAKLIVASLNFTDVEVSELRLKLQRLEQTLEASTRVHDLADRAALAWMVRAQVVERELDRIDSKLLMPLLVGFLELVSAASSLPIEEVRERLQTEMSALFPKPEDLSTPEKDKTSGA